MSTQPNADTSFTSPSLRLLSWNVAGLNTPIKRKKVIAHLKRSNPDIIFLQETHWRQNSESGLRAPWLDVCYTASHTSTSRGVAILFRRGLPHPTEILKKDPEGRYLIVRITVDSIPYILVNLYAPNHDQHAFYPKLLHELLQYADHQLIIGGDFNVTQDPTLDRTGNSRLSQTHALTHSLASFKEHLNLCDPWRITNADNREYTCHSSSHDTFSRIDYYLISISLYEHHNTSRINPIIISDHAPIILQLRLRAPTLKTINWRFPSYLKESEEFRSYLKVHWNNYIDDNISHKDDVTLLWSAAKAVMRGHIINYVTRHRRTTRKHFKDLHISLLDAQKTYAQSPTPQTQQAYREAKRLLDALVATQAHTQLRRTQNTYYRWGNKTGALLAKLTSQKHPYKPVLQLRDPNTGTVTSKSEEIAEIFREYYEDLYRASPSNAEEIQQFLDTIQFPTLTQDERDLLDSDIQVDEIRAIIMSAKNGKTPGPDGLSAEFYKMLSPDIVPTLTDALNAVFKHSAHIDRFHESRTILLPKPQKDHTHPASYRPISLLNHDYKILSKILANRLQMMLPRLLHSSQTGFTQGRNSIKNIRTAIAATTLAQDPSHPISMLMSLDAEKAFDKVAWPFLYANLSLREFGQNFTNYIYSSHSGAETSITINGHNTAPIDLFRGTRQGCPLSPLLFNISIDPLLRHLESTQAFEGIGEEGRKLKIAAFADDILLFIDRPRITIPNLLQELSHVGALSGYTLNLDKTEALLLKGPSRPLWSASYSFKWQTNSLLYLGVRITKLPSKLYKENITPYVQKLETTIQTWKGFMLSYLGRANLIKMVEFPRLLYLLHSLPIYLSPKDEKAINFLYRTFIWGGKRSKIAYRTLQQDRLNGGINFPNIRNYNLAALARIIQDWLNGTSGFANTELERSFSPRCSLPNLLHLPHDRLTDDIKGNPLLYTTWKGWCKMRSNWQTSHQYSLYLTFTYNLDFQEGCSHRTFHNWQRQGITSIKDILHIQDRRILTLSELNHKFPAIQFPFFTYLQAKSYTAKIIPKLTDKDWNEVFIGWFSTQPSTKGQISKFYRYVTISIDYANAHSPLTKWRLDDPTLSYQLILNAMEQANKFLPSSRYLEMRLKISHRAYLTPHRGYLMGVYATADCFKCHAPEANLFHCLWACPVIQQFWQRIRQFVTDNLTNFVPNDPSWAIFGYLDPDIHRCEDGAKKFLHLVAAAGAKAILQTWLDEQAPAFRIFLDKLTFLFKMDWVEAVTHKERLTQPFFETWESFVSILPPHIRQKLRECFQSSVWYQEQTLAGVEPV